jgi:hypothetical protein
LNVSDVKPEPISGDSGTNGAGPADPEMSASSAPETAAAEVEAPRLAPEQEETSPKPDPLKTDAHKIEVSKIDAGKPEAPRHRGRMMILPPGERAWGASGDGVKAEAAAGQGMSGKRRMSAMAAVVALATVAGALGGAMATAGLSHLVAGDSSAAAKDSALEAAVARIDADIVALKASVAHTSRVATGQFNKTSDRLEKVEKAQAEPAAKLARLSEAVEKLRAAAVPAKDITGSVSHPATTAAAAAPSKPEVGRLPKVKDWVLRDVDNGYALIEGRRGLYEVYAGDPVPGLGRVDAIRKQDGRWVVVTSKGLIVAR